MPLGPNMAPTRGHMFFIGLIIWGKHEKIFLSETTRPRALIFGMWHLLVDLYQVCSNYVLSLGPKMTPPRGHMFYIVLYWENIKNLPV